MLTCSPAQAQAVALTGKCMRSRRDASQDEASDASEDRSWISLRLPMHSDQRPRRHDPTWVRRSAGRGQFRYKGEPER